MKLVSMHDHDPVAHLVKPEGHGPQLYSHSCPSHVLLTRSMHARCPTVKAVAYSVRWGSGRMLVPLASFLVFALELRDRTVRVPAPHASCNWVCSLVTGMRRSC